MSRALDRHIRNEESRKDDDVRRQEEFVAEQAITIPKRPQLHFSGLDKLWSCGEQFRRIYLTGERMPKGTYIAVGSGVDIAVTRDLESKILDRQLLSLEEVKDQARDSATWELENNEIVLDKDERQLGQKKAFADAVDKAVRLAALHHKYIAPKLHPTHVQRKWEIEIPGIPFDLVGTIDVQEGPIAVRDTKTSGKSPSAGIADMSLQLSTYALAIKVLDGDAPATVALDYLIDNKVPVAKSYVSDRNDDDFRVLLARVENAAEIIEKQAFTPAQPSDWRCSADWCGFHGSCKYAQQPKSFAVNESSKTK